MITPKTTNLKQKQFKNLSEVEDAYNEMVLWWDFFYRNLRDDAKENETVISTNTTNITTIQGEQARLAYFDGAVGTGSTNNCFLDTDTTGESVLVYFNICNGSDLNAATPRLNDGDPIVVVKIGTKWYCTGLFNNVGAC